MIILERWYNYYIILSKNGEVWLTKRVKTRRDSRRRKHTKKSIFYIPLKKYL